MDEYITWMNVTSYFESSDRCTLCLIQMRDRLVLKVVIESKDQLKPLERCFASFKRGIVLFSR